MGQNLLTLVGILLSGLLLFPDSNITANQQTSGHTQDGGLPITVRQPSALPPGNLKPGQVPQFVTMSFDDNTVGTGIDWALDLFRGRKNPDGSPARTSFYMNTHGLPETDNNRKQPVQQPSGEGVVLAESIRRIAGEGHEIGNHTHNHLRDIDKLDWTQFEKTMLAMPQQEWRQRIQQCSDRLHIVAGIPKTAITGFRTPFLKYNQATFSVLSDQRFTYDTSIEEGHSGNFDGTNFRWPYTLEQGSPGHNESWVGSPHNPNRVTLGSTPALWEFPVYVLIVPDDAQSRAYGIAPGLWQRMKQRSPYIRNHRISAIDYNLFVAAGLSGKEVTGILKYNLDLRLQGNRAPMMFIAHSQYYVNPQWIKNNAPHLTQSEMKSAIADFLDYALSKPAVRLDSANNVIKWCQNPKAL